MNRELTWRSSSPDETEAFGRRIGSLLAPGDMVSLRGDLGSGKTVLVRGICAALGCAEDVKSPSFILVREYEGKFPVFHIDLYRLADAREWRTLGVDDRLEEGIALVEWGDRIGGAFPGGSLELTLREGAGETDRVLHLAWDDERLERLGETT